MTEYLRKYSKNLYSMILKFEFDIILNRFAKIYKVNSKC